MTPEPPDVMSGVTILRGVTVEVAVVMEEDEDGGGSRGREGAWEGYSWIRLAGVDVTQKAGDENH